MAADWALIKGYKLLYPNTSTSDKDILHHCKSYPPYQHIAEYIEQHEEAPLCPYLKRAREIYANSYSGPANNMMLMRQEILDGDYDTTMMITMIIQALKESV